MVVIVVVGVVRIVVVVGIVVVLAVVAVISTANPLPSPEDILPKKIFQVRTVTRKFKEPVWSKQGAILLIFRKFMKNGAFLFLW